MDDLTKTRAYAEVYALESSAAVYGSSRTQWTARDLLATSFPEPRWAVPHLVSEGLNMLAGSPKIGKSWASLGLGVAIASGGRAFGCIEVDPGPVLYLALEDQPRRLQRRLRAMLRDQPAPSAFHIWTECDRLPEGGGAIEAWLDAQPTARLVVIDIWARVRPPVERDQSSYEGDYLASRHLKRLADERGVAVLLVHHTRKAGSDDWLDMVSGTNGLAGACDGVLMLKRSRGKATAELMVTGRDVEENTLAMEFDSECCAWKLLDGPAESYSMQPTRRAIYGLLRQHGPLTPKELAGLIRDVAPDTVRQNLSRMVKDEQLDTDGEGHYFLPVTAVTPVTSKSDRDARDGCDTQFGGVEWTG